MGGWAHGQTGDDGWPSMRAAMSFNRRKQLAEGGTDCSEGTLSFTAVSRHSVCMALGAMGGQPAVTRGIGDDETRAEEERSDR